MLAQINSEYGAVFQTDNFQNSLAYLVDVFEHFNSVNLKLQGEGVNVITCKHAIDAFTRKLSLWHGKINNNEFGMFQELSERCRDNPLCPNLKEVILDHLNALRNEMVERFEDIADAHQFSFVLNPFTTKLEDIQGFKKEEELIDIQASITKQRYFETYGFIKFWIDEGQSVAPILTKTAMEKAILPFVTSYLAESIFSAVIQIKSKCRNRLILNNDLRLAVTKVKPNIKELVEQLQAQGGH